MPINIIDNIDEYFVMYNPNNQEIDGLDSVELLFQKGMLKTTKRNQVKFLYPIFKPFAIEVRLMIYALMDFKEITGSKEFKMYEFCDWIASNKRYRNYLILVWITKLHKKLEKDNYFYRQMKYCFTADNIAKTSNLQDFNSFEHFDIDLFKKSTLKNFTMNKTKIRKTLYLLGNTAFLDIYDNHSKSKKSINEIEFVNEEEQTVEMIKLNKAFFEVRRRFILDNWLF